MAYCVSCNKMFSAADSLSVVAGLQDSPQRSSPLGIHVFPSSSPTERGKLNGVCQAGHQITTDLAVSWCNLIGDSKPKHATELFLNVCCIDWNFEVSSTKLWNNLLHSNCYLMEYPSAPEKHAKVTRVLRQLLLLLWAWELSYKDKIQHFICWAPTKHNVKNKRHKMIRREKRRAERGICLGTWERQMLRNM